MRSSEDPNLVNNVDELGLGILRVKQTSHCPTAVFHVNVVDFVAFLSSVPTWCPPAHVSAGQCECGAELETLFRCVNMSYINVN